MAQSFQVSLPRGGSDLEFAAEQEEIARRRRLADVLRQQSAQPEGQMVSGRFVAPSWTQRLAGLFNAYQSGQIDRQAADQSRQVAQQRAERTANDIGAVVNAMTGGRNYTQTGMTGGLDSQDMTVEQGRPDLAQALRAAGAAQSPEARAFVPQILGMQQRQGERAEDLQARQDAMRAQQQFQADQARQAREQQMEILRMRSEDMRASQAERIAAQQQLAQMQIDARRDMANMAAAVRSAGGGAVQPVTVMREGVPTIVDARTGRAIGQAVPNEGRAGGPTAAQREREATTTEGRQQLSSVVSSLLEDYRALANMGALVDPRNPAQTNLFARLRSSAPGQLAEGALGTQAQTHRDNIRNARQLLFLAVKNASGLPAAAMNSNMELQAWLNAMTDPTQSPDTIERTLGNIETIIGRAQRDWQQNQLRSGGAAVGPLQGSGGSVATPAPAAPAPAAPRIRIDINGRPIQ